MRGEINYQDLRQNNIPEIMLIFTTEDFEKFFFPSFFFENYNKRN